MTLAKKLTKPTGRPVKAYGPTWGHAHVSSAIDGTAILNKAATGRYFNGYGGRGYTVPGGQSR